MSFISEFEDRIAALFDTAPQGYVEPFSFKKLAKRAAKEMENETYEIDGIDTAPALYTVLVSAADDTLMRPLYSQITEEVSTFVAQQANKKGYIFVGKPLVRFMVDPSLRSGKFAVFAENIDNVTLARLRKEEKAFLMGTTGAVGTGGVAAKPATSSVPARTASPNLIPLDNAYADDGLSSSDDGLGDGLLPLPSLGGAAASGIPQTQRRSSPVDAPVGRHAAFSARTAQEPDAAGSNATALLIDRLTGRTFKVSAPSSVIGRERSVADVVLSDPNISRSHAEIRFDGRNWRVVDLRSTNGTLVNDIDIDECILHSGDLITVGLTNLEFREN